MVDLEQRVARLADQTISGPTSAVGAASARAGDGGASKPARSVEERLATIEARLDALVKQSGAKRGPTVNDLVKASPPQEEAILSVVERETSRIRDVQLEWHRARWLETREQQLSSLAANMHLDTDQTSALRAAMESEADEMVAVLRRPSSATDPDQAAADWQAALNTTDKRALGVLTPEQQQVWIQLRQFERSVLWPWLPK